MIRRAIILVIVLASLAGCRAGQQDKGTIIRPPVVAGKFYSDDPVKLEQGIRDYLADALPVLQDASGKAEGDPGRDITGIIVPHAGYIYSGQIAADGFRQVMGGNYEVVVILGTNHTTGVYNGVSVYTRGGFRTPLGVASIDEEIAERLIEGDDRFTFDPSVHATEHSVEVEIPFIQVALGKVKIVPVVIGGPYPGLCEDFGKRLAEVLRGRKALLVASTDLSHYPSYNDAVEVDRGTLDAIESFNPDEVHSRLMTQMGGYMPGLSTCACGEGPILTVLTAARELGARHATVISYANSGDIPIGERSRVVGYGAVLLYSGDRLKIESPWNDQPISHEKRLLSEEDRKSLLHLARKTITGYLKTETIPLPRGFSPASHALRGAFVTLHKHGELRGCIGHMAEDTPLCTVIGSMAIQAAFNDHRFRPVTVDELADLDLEISALTPYEKVSGPNKIVIGRDGVLLRKSGRSAVFLPQVAPEQGWDLEETLENLCIKAGLPPGSWQEGAELYTFQAEVFGEIDYRKE